MVRVLTVFLVMWALLLPPSFLADCVIGMSRMLVVSLSGLITFGGFALICYFLFRSPAEQASNASDAFDLMNSHIAFDITPLLRDCQACLTLDAPSE